MPIVIGLHDPHGTAGLCCRFTDKEVQRDAKLVSYDVVEKNTKPYVQVEIADEKKVRL